MHILVHYSYILWCMKWMYLIIKEKIEWIIFSSKIRKFVTFSTPSFSEMMSIVRTIDHKARNVWYIMYHHFLYPQNNFQKNPSNFLREISFLGKITKNWIFLNLQVGLKFHKVYAHPYTLCIPILNYGIDISDNKVEDTVNYSFLKN